MISKEAECKTFKLKQKKNPKPYIAPLNLTCQIKHGLHNKSLQLIHMPVLNMCAWLEHTGYFLGYSV